MVVGVWGTLMPTKDGVYIISREPLEDGSIIDMEGNVSGLWFIRLYNTTQGEFEDLDEFLVETAKEIKDIGHVGVIDCPAHPEACRKFMIENDNEHIILHHKYGHYYRGEKDPKVVKE